jgi:tRNA pseudouridine38-40 synthase
LSRYFIKISFKGTEYHGWQIQPGAVSVQGTIDRALSLILKENIILTGAGRTDAGVHAVNFIAHFDSARDNLHSGNDLKYKLNSFLPRDIFIHEIHQVDQTDHARYSARSRTYHYLVTRYKNLFLEDFSYNIYRDLNIDRMNEACQFVKNNSDFTSFSKLNGNNKSNICKITDIGWYQPSNSIIVFHISADRFLRGMVRALVGTMLDIGSGKNSPETIKDIMLKKDRNLSGMAAPAKGLIFTNVRYEDGVIPAEINEFSNPLFPLSSLFS